MSKSKAIITSLSGLVLLIICMGCEYIYMEPFRLLSAQGLGETLGQTGIDQVNTGFNLEFSKDANQTACFQAISLKVKSSPLSTRLHQEISLNAQWQSATIVRLIPKSPLQINERYQLTLSTQARDLWGNSLAEDWECTIAAAGPAQAPTINTASPELDAVLDNLFTTLELNFSNPVDALSLQRAFNIQPALNGTLSLDSTGLKARFVPASNYTRGTRYTWSISTALCDRTGTPIQEAWSREFLAMDNDQKASLTSISASGQVMQALPNWNAKLDHRQGFILTFDRPIVTTSLMSALSFQPSLEWRLAPGTALNEGAVHIEFPQAPNRKVDYRLQISESWRAFDGSPGRRYEYQLDFRSPSTLPPQLDFSHFGFLTKPSTETMVVLQPYGQINIQAYQSNIPLGTLESRACIDLLLTVADPAAELANPIALSHSALPCFSLNTTNNAASTLNLLGIELLGTASNSPSSALTPNSSQIILRLWVHIQDNQIYLGLINLTCSGTFTDSLGNSASINYATSFNETGP